MAKATHMQDHFAQVAEHYRNVRTTDEAPIHYICQRLAERGCTRAADVGCGAGRYDLLLLQKMPELHLLCIDRSAEMLRHLTEHLREAGIDRFEPVQTGVDELRLKDNSLDAVFTFNAIHHFDFPAFIRDASRALRTRGQIFIYTRTPEQNAKSVWGQYFPGFLDKEQRLYSQDQMRTWVEASGCVLSNVETFQFTRRATVARLLQQAHARHYSTLSLYETQEFAEALQTFEHNIQSQGNGSDAVVWDDENVLLVIESQPAN